ncbi:LAETG motif-containing sortase-dependent surface protein [Streptomyces sp. AK02-01A]|uniref:LAETG motif-containing sortase-dependent surface protein n=1 Tax=Streptomyces sp. AK02-01A TaxID=3028648 RepID=UPI0029A53832|nr:LAETG motif-containing sortase-dependent surface protein [Streptomyces sp. AK02-01A]MDX3854544.1 LAETG motif-containing sortase-dependent surface protein [Streptomyces sp. AK02-01A]
MTVFSGSWRRRGALITIATAGALGVGLSAAPAMAHTPVWTVSCSEVSVDLTSYGNSDKNTVNITVDGKDLLPTKSFKNEFHQKLDLPEHTSEVSVRLVVKAADGDQYSKDETKTAPVCDTPGTPPPASDSPKPTPSETATTEAPTPTEEPSSSSDVLPTSKPSPAGDDLAETGSSSATPIIAGAAAVVLVAGAGIMWASRKRRTAQH